MIRTVTLILALMMATAAMPLRTLGASSPAPPTAASILRAFQDKVDILTRDYTQQVNQVVVAATAQLAGLNHQDHAQIGSIHTRQRSAVTRIDAAYHRALNTAGHEASLQLSVLHDRQAEGPARTRLGAIETAAERNFSALKYRAWRIIDAAAQAADNRGRRR